MVRTVWLLELKLPNGMPVYLTELLGTGNAALVADPYLAIQFTQHQYAIDHLVKCKEAAPPEVASLVMALKPEEHEFQI